MRAVWYEQAGPAAQVLHYGELATPEPRPGEVRVKVAHSAVNPTDVKRCESGRELGQFARIVPNNDGAGMIEAVGEGVPASRRGERVWVFGAQAMRPFGTAAESVVVPSRQAVALPDGVPLEQGACLGVPAVTAHRCLFADGTPEGLAVLVTGGAGRVGRCAVQLAKWAGATLVVATVGSTEKAEQVRALGADLVLDYRRDDVVSEIRKASEGGVERIVEVEFGANIAAAPKLLKPNGVIACYASLETAPALPFHPLMYNNTTVRLVAIFGMPQAAQDRAFADVTACLAAGRLKSRIDRRFGFADMVAAHETVARGEANGCVLVDVAP